MKTEGKSFMILNFILQWCFGCGTERTANKYGIDTLDFIKIKNFFMKGHY